jgi:hypothetical protein
VSLSRWWYTKTYSGNPVRVKPKMKKKLCWFSAMRVAFKNKNYGWLIYFDQMLATSAARTDYTSWIPKFHPGFDCGVCCPIFSVPCYVLWIVVYLLSFVWRLHCLFLFSPLCAYHLRIRTMDGFGMSRDWLFLQYAHQSDLFSSWKAEDTIAKTKTDKWVYINVLLSTF